MLALGVAMSLGGCAQHGGYPDASWLAGDPGRAGQNRPAPRDARYEEADQYPPADDTERAMRQVDLPPSRTSAGAGPGAGYAAPGERRGPPPPRPPADLPLQVADATGPRGTSGDEQRYDAVGYASWYGEEMGDAPTASGQRFAPGAIAAAHRSLPIGSVAEVTALDTGRTILVLINDRTASGNDREIDLSRGAAQQLGLNATAPVRVRLVNAPPSDIMALRAGRAAPPRIDSPPALLAALRRKLPQRVGAAPPRRPRPAAARPAPDGVPLPDRASLARPTPDRATRDRPVTAGIFVQVAALSSEARAQALATTLHGRVAQAGALYRVQIGPFANARAAQQARDDAARRGYGDARIVKTN